MADQYSGKDWRRDWSEYRIDEKQFAFSLMTAFLGIGAGLFLGFILFTEHSDRMSYLVNMYTGILSTLVTIGVIDKLNERRAESQLKAQLIREMGGSNNGIALRAVRELRARGWLQDSSLERVDLVGANLKKARLEQAYLRAANLKSAKLKGAILLGANLLSASSCMARHYHDCLTALASRDSSWSGMDHGSAILAAIGGTVWGDGAVGRIQVTV